MATTMTQSSAQAGRMTGEEIKVILASSVGTVFEWYDFYIYGTLATILAKQFFCCLRLPQRKTRASMAKF